MNYVIVLVKYKDNPRYIDSIWPSDKVHEAYDYAREHTTRDAHYHVVTLELYQSKEFKL